jgi:tungstate transport system substrate-binding protein
VSSPPAPPTRTPSPRPLTLATTTSTQDSGLLDLLLPKFRAETGIDVKVVAVGSGQAMELGRRGDADVLLVHAPEAEQQFVQEGYGVHRYPLMFNDFVIVGPLNDPVAIKGMTSAVEALRKIAAAKGTFVSRADKSGTHAKEQSLWKLAEINPQGDWYLKAGAGMAETLRTASEKGAYTLTDRATYLAQRTKLDLEVVVVKDELLLNHYALVQLSAAKYPDLNHEGAERFISFLFGSEAQRAIATFGQDKFGQPLFFLLRSDGGKPAKPVILPANLQQPVLVLDYQGMALPPVKEPYLQIRSDGKVIVGAPFRDFKRIETELSGDDLQTLMHFIVRENDLFGFSPDLVKGTIEAEVQNGRQSPGNIEPTTTVIRVRANGQEREIQYVELDRAARLFPEIRQLAQLHQVERRLNLLICTLRAGDREILETALSLANDQLTQQSPAVKPLGLDDLRGVGQGADGTLVIHFFRQSDTAVAPYYATTSATVERPVEGEAKVTIESTEK